MANQSKLSNRIGLFAAIPHSFIKQFPALTSTEIALFVYLVYRSGDSDGAFPAVNTIRTDTGMTFNTIARAMRGLTEKGWIERQRRFGRSTIYTIKYPDSITQMHKTEADISITQMHNDSITQMHSNGILIHEQDSKNKISMSVRVIFAYWQSHLEHPKSLLTSDRESKIKARLNDGYTVEDCKLAIEGCALSPHHMGQNDQKVKYDDLTLILRDGTHLERFRSIAQSRNGKAQSPQVQPPNVDARSRHKAVRAVEGVLLAAVLPEHYDNLIATFGDEPDHARMRECRNHWCERKGDMFNLGWLFAWYFDGIPETDDIPTGGAYDYSNKVETFCKPY